MKKLFLLAIFLPILLSAGTIVKTFNFSEKDLKLQPIGEYYLINLNGLPAYQIPGKPIVPIAVYNVLIPASAEVRQINVIAKQEKTISGEYLLYPAQEPQPISYQGPSKFINPDITIYNSEEVYPDKYVDWSSTGTKSGYRLASFAIFPIHYVPSERKLMLLSEITLEIVYEENKVFAQPITEKQKEIFSSDIKRLVINPDDIEKYAPPISIARDNEIDCVIITNDAFLSNFEQLVDWHNKKGFRTEVKSTTTISSSYTGRDLPEKIRNFILDYYLNYGLKWVILAGDNSIVPARRARAIVGTYTGNIPADLYYSDLQWSWDGNNNNIFGEAGYDTVDFFADVYVGRLSVDNVSEINTVINKIFTYEKSPDTTYIKKMLLPAAYLWQNYNHQMSQDSIANISPAGWIDRVINQGQNDGLRYQVRDSINAGFGYIHLVGHGDDVGVYINNQPQYYYTDPATQTNYTKLSIVNSIACYPGNFEYSDCLAEKMLLAQGCAVAVMMNSRYGWGTPPTIGPSELLDVRFWDYFFNYDSSFIGSCLGVSKDVYRYLAESQQVWRWCVFELNLFGDPILPMWSDTPANIQLAMPDTIETGPQTLQVSVTKNGQPISNVLVGVYKPNEVYAQAKTNSLGQVNILVNALTPGKMYVTVSGKNCFPQTDSLVVIQGSALPYLVLNSVSNSQVNPNTTVNLNAIVSNIGSAPATNTIGKLRTNSSYITLIDSVANYGTINAGAQASGDGFTFFVSANTPNGTQIPFSLNLTADQGIWNYNFNILCGQQLPPGMVIANHDTGYCLLTVTALGSIGYNVPSERIGSGFRYPKSSISSLYFSSMLAGNSASYVVDRFYGQPATTLNQDWSIVESLRFVTPPSFGEQHLQCSYNDANHPSPKGLKVIQNSYSLSDARYDDFIVLVYDYQNTGTTTISGLYSGIIADFDIPPDSATVDVAYTNASKRLVYMRRAANQTPTVGVKLLTPTTAANLTVIDHDRYVYPDSAMSESMKYRILNGGINQAQSNRTYDWSVAVSAGPFNLAPSQTYRVAYAFVGGNSEALLFENADSAQSWYDRYFSGICEENNSDNPKLTNIVKLNRTVNPSYLRYDLTTPNKVKIGIYDIAGQLKAEIISDIFENSNGKLLLPINQLTNGIYFMKIEMGNNNVTEKFLIVK
ncbi:MAG: C25 family cysteine peptidase [candidate division WOR-3 bacterium]